MFVLSLLKCHVRNFEVMTCFCLFRRWCSSLACLRFTSTRVLIADAVLWFITFKLHVLQVRLPSSCRGAYSELRTTVEPCFQLYLANSESFAVCWAEKNQCRKVNVVFVHIQNTFIRRVSDDSRLQGQVQCPRSFTPLVVSVVVFQKIW